MEGLAWKLMNIARSQGLSAMGVFTQSIDWLAGLQWKLHYMHLTAISVCSLLNKQYTNNNN